MESTFAKDKATEGKSDRKISQDRPLAAVAALL